MPNDQPKVQFPVGGIPLEAIRIFLPLLVAGVIGYGAAKQATGQNEAENQELRRLATTNKAEIDYLRSTSVSKEQMDLLLKMVDATRSDVQDIRRELVQARERR